MKAAANPPDDGQIVAKSNDASGWQFKTSPDTGPHTFGVGVAGATNTFAQRYSTTVRSLNVWYHVAGVYNASARTLDIYVNGVLNNGTLSGTVPASQINSAVNVNIGRRSGGGFYFNGVIDDVRIYNRALSQAEIQADMNTPVGTPTSTPTPTQPDGNSDATPQHLLHPTTTATPTHTYTNGNADGNSYRDTNSYGYIHADTYATPTATATFTPTPTATATATFTPTPTRQLHQPRHQLQHQQRLQQRHQQRLQQQPRHQHRHLLLVWWRRTDSMRGAGRS